MPENKQGHFEYWTNNFVPCHRTFLSCFLKTRFISGSLESPVFLGGLPMKRNISKASNSYLKKETLKIAVSVGH